MKKNRIFIVLMIIVFLFGVEACSGNKEAGSTESQSAVEVEGANDEAQKTDVNNEDADSSNEKDSEEPKPDLSVARNLVESADLPDNYPVDKFPIFKGSYVASAVGVEGSFTVIAFSKEDFKKVSEFYKELLKDAEVMNETDSDSSFTSFGTVNDYSYNLDVGESSEIEGYVTSISIILMPG